MSEVPPPYNRSYSFTDFSTYTPNLQQPGNKIDQELNNVRVSVNATIDRLSEIQRDDGKLDSTSLDFNDVFTELLPNLSLTFAAIDSPVFTGSPKAPTPLTSDNSTKIATTEFVKLQEYATQNQLNSIQSSLSNYLTLSGGTLTGDIIFPADLSGNDSQIGPWGLGVENINGQVAYIQPDVFRIYNSVQTTGTSLNGEGITFNDSTKQTTAFNSSVLDNYLPLTGGTITGNTNFVNAEYSVDVSVTGQFNVINATTTYIGDGIQVYDDSGTMGIYSAGIIFPDSSVQTTAALPLTGGIMSGAIRFDSVGTQNIAKGSFDSGRGGYNGISLTCAVDYELNWQAGYLKALNSGGFVVPINVEDSSLVLIQNRDGVEEGDLPPYIRTITITGNGINQAGNNDIGDYNFYLNNYGAGGVSNSYNNWAINSTGVAGASDEGDSNWHLNQNGVNGYRYDGGITWAFNEIQVGSSGDSGTWYYGLNGAKFVDGTIQTTAALPLTGGTITGKVNINPTGTTTAPLNIKTGIIPATPLPGDIWIATDSFNYQNSSGVTRTVATLANNNPFTNYQSISVSNNSNPALKITQLGTGEALRVEDETSPDATAFVVSNNGRVGVGVAPDATVALTVDSTGIKVNGMVIVPATTVTNSIYSSGNMSHSQYPKELIVTLAGVQYAIPLRVV